MNDIILTKESSNDELKRYFNAVLELSKDNNEFPINFDQVWMLVYKDKHKAVSELKDKFIEDIDYQAFTQKVECSNGIGSSTRIDYYLTVSCMEFFIARKVRPVFEVYRQVFHKVANTKPKSLIEDQMKAISWASDFLNLNDTSKLIMAKSVLEPLGITVPNYVPSKDILHSASELLKKYNIGISARAFNIIAEEKGFIVENTRKSSLGKEKRFKTITEKGLVYGENQISPNNPKETQPLWYEGKFLELLDILQIKVSCRDES